MCRSIGWVSVAFVIVASVLASPASAGVFVNSDMTQEKVATPGETYRGTIVLKNLADTPAEAKIYQTDYRFTADGSNEYGEPGRLPRSNARWVSLSRELVTVPPKGTELLDYEVTVPGGSSLSGSYWSLIMVEPIAPDSGESAAELPEGTARIKQTLRYGIQVVTHLGSPGPAGLEFTNPQVIKENDQRFFAIDVENTGQRLLRPTLSLDLYSASGNPIGKFQGIATRLFPGTSARFKIDLGNTPKGQFLGLVVADGTGDNLFGANVELEIE